MSASLFDAVRADGNRATLPIVIVSDTPEKADASLRARNAEHVLLIPKPFTGAQIARALHELLSSSSSSSP
jgi:CheY-like chemotaxis protein